MSNLEPGLLSTLIFLLSFVVGFFVTSFFLHKFKWR